MKSKICPNCGKPMYKSSKVCQECRSQAGSNNGSWKGGVSKDFYKYKLTQKERYPDKIKARDIVMYAIRSKKLVRGSCCICGKESAEAHHEDYAKPLEITWLCKTHHRQFHGGEIEISVSQNQP